MNVLNLTGRDFLQLYSLLLVTCILAAFALRWWLRHPGIGDDLAPGKIPDLHPLEVAYLSGGANRVIDSAIALLVHRGNLTVSKSTHRLSLAGPPPEDVTPLERQIVLAVVKHTGRVAAVQKSVHDTARSVTGRLLKLGLAPTPGQRVRIRILPFLLFLALLALGIAKINVGLQRNRPVEFLMLLSLITFVIGLGFAIFAPIRTTRGSKLLGVLQRRHNALQSTAGRAPNSLAGEDLSLACALFGVGVFAYGPMSDLKHTLEREANKGSNSFVHSCGASSGSSCGSSSSSSCGGGGGGGGGCGGCGGGGS